MDDQLAQIRAERALRYQQQKDKESNNNNVNNNNTNSVNSNDNSNVKQQNSNSATSNVVTNNNNNTNNVINNNNVPTSPVHTPIRNTPTSPTHSGPLLQDMSVLVTRPNSMEQTILELNPIFSLKTCFFPFFSKHKMDISKFVIKMGSRTLDLEKTPTDCGIQAGDTLAIEDKASQPPQPTQQQPRNNNTNNNNINTDLLAKALADFSQQYTGSNNNNFNGNYGTFGGISNFGGGGNYGGNGYFGGSGNFGGIGNFGGGGGGFGGGSSVGEDWQVKEAMKLSAQTAEKERNKYEKLETALVSRGLKIHHMSDDGNCLFRAISDQLLGDDSLHAYSRDIIVNHMASNPESFLPFVTEEFETYLAKMACDGEYGTNLEIQALMQYSNRPVEVYTDEAGAEPMNIFQGTHFTGNPIRLSYHRGNHYNSVVPITNEEAVVPPTSFAVYKNNNNNNKNN